MKIWNIRHGFATNSSSSHSIIMGPNLANRLKSDSPYSDFCFGWENFTLTTREEKQAYLAVAFSRLKEGDFAALLPEELYEPSQEGYIDHESHGLISPIYKRDSQVIDLELTKLLVDEILSDDVVILGGNDNGEGHPNEGDGDDFDFPSGWWRKDRVDGHWTIFEPYSGTKVRFHANDAPPEDPKLTLPELVDLKITDYCPFGCAYCYQSSTKSGVHAPKEHVFEIIDELAKMEVFEIAFGGGETTMHPDFWEILKYTRERHIIPNFTTRNLSWLGSKTKNAIINEKCGGWAYSVDTAKDVKLLAKKLDKNEVHGAYKKRASVQYVLGCNDFQNYKEIVDLCNKEGLRLTLLGYKSVGFGKTQEPHPYEGWLDLLLELKKSKKWGWSFSLGIDTALAAGHEEELQKAGISHRLYHITEGSSSMYIDAVKRVVAPSSYTEPINYKPYFEAKNLLDLWDGIEPEVPSFLKDFKKELEDQVF